MLCIPEILTNMQQTRQAIHLEDVVCVTIYGSIRGGFLLGLNLEGCSKVGILPERRKTDHSLVSGTFDNFAFSSTPFWLWSFIMSISFLVITRECQVNQRPLTKLQDNPSSSKPDLVSILDPIRAP